MVNKQKYTQNAGRLVSFSYVLVMEQKRKAKTHFPINFQQQPPPLPNATKRTSLKTTSDSADDNFSASRLLSSRVFSNNSHHKQRTSQAQILPPHF